MWGGACILGSVYWLPIPRERSSSAPQFWGFASIYTYTFSRRTTKFHTVTHIRPGLFLEVSHAPSQGSEAPAIPNCGASFLFMCIIHPLSQKYKIWRGNSCGEGRMSWGQPRLPSQESGIPALHNFGVLLYLCLRPLTQNDQIRHSNNTHGEWHIFRRSATPLHLHKRVARFVSDHWLSCTIPI